MPDVKDDLGGLGLYGWVFSGFFLASLLGIVVAGQLADRRGLVLPFAVGLVLFSIGLVVGGAAGSMPMLVVGRAPPGLRRRRHPGGRLRRHRPRVSRPRSGPGCSPSLSTAWVVPGLIGPASPAGRARPVVALGVPRSSLPLVVVAGVMTVPALRAPRRAEGAELDGRRPAPTRGAAADRRGWARWCCSCSASAPCSRPPADAPLALAVVLVVVGAPARRRAFVGLVPTGTVRLGPGVPATVAVRGLLTCGFFAADAYVSLAVVDGRGGTTLARRRRAVGRRPLTWTHRHRGSRPA